MLGSRWWVWKDANGVKKGRSSDGILLLDQWNGSAGWDKDWE
jgi:hypothetical protein